VRKRHGDVTGVVFRHEPTVSEIAGLIALAEEADLVIVGTVNATQGQSDLVTTLARLATPLVTIAMREPQDLPTYPTVGTHICTYCGHTSSLAAAVDAMFGTIEFGGRLPVSIPGLYPIGHGAGS
jgi:beta-N-acetylhexosaminidase